MTWLVLVLGDQLSEGLSALREADRESDVVVMAEVTDEASYVSHHPKKIALVFAAMRKFSPNSCAATGGMSAMPGWTIRKTRAASWVNCCAVRRKPGRNRCR